MISLRVLQISKVAREINSRRCSHILAYVNDLERRSLLKNSYPNDILTTWNEKLKQIPPCLYAGFDPTADSLHIGNLLVLINLIRGSQFNCQPIALVGGFTASAGDPSGRDTERDEILDEIVEKNGQAITEQIRKIGENCLGTTKNKLLMVNNEEWFTKMSSRSFAKIFKNFRLSQGLKMGAVKRRIENGAEISFSEFNYQIYQAYDWLQLADRYKCFFQIGGSDQLGHLDFGAHHIKKTRNKAFAAGICLPLLTDTDGNKLGKSVGGGVWLSAQKTSPYHFYQFFRQLHDDVAEDLLPKFSLKSIEEVDAIIKIHKNNLGKWIAQDVLAAELTSFVHGKEGLNSAVRCSRVLFQGNSEDVKSLSRTELLDLFKTVVKIGKSQLSTMGNLADLTREDKQKGSSLMLKGAFSVNGEKIVDPNIAFAASSAVIPNSKDLILIRWGKRNFRLVQLV